ncbi:retinaldehyde-binding protein 1-like isoform X2 [Planococcus citri]|uniref:retinaldehyde-binding protein 1-like isoform X2 n=1 Tax=Planococcus citri TaxID=170843 RepID=UPI0031F72B41
MENSQLELTMGAFDEEEQTYWPPNENPLNIDKEWRHRAETELNEDPEKAKENMKLLAKKLADDKTLNSRTDDVFLMAFLRGRKHNVDSAHKLIKTYYEMKHAYPEFYRDALPSEKGHLYDMGYLGLIPGEDRAGHRLCVCIPGRMDFSQISVEEVFQVGCSIFEIALLNPEIQISGVSVIMDLTGMTLLQQARLINPRFAWQLTNCIQEKIPVRLRGVHVLHQPSYYTALYAIFRPFLKRKLRKRIHLHGSDMSSLHDFISPEYLPAEWGGKRPEYNAKAITKLIKENENKLIEWRQYGIKK